MLREKQEKRQSQLARSPVPVHRIAEQETPVKIESPEEKVLRKKQFVQERRLRLERSPPPVPVCKPVQRYGSTGTDS